MKIKEIINFVSLTKINVYIIIALAVAFSIVGCLVYDARDNTLKQSMGLKSTINAQHVVEEIKSIVYEHCETIKNCNMLVVNYLPIQQDKQKVFNHILKNMLYSLKTVDALCIVFDNEKSDIYEDPIIIYAERLENDSIIINNYFDIYQEPRLLFQNAPAEIEIKGPHYWKINKEGKEKQFLVLWQRIYDSEGTAIGTIYLDILCSNYFSYVSDIANSYNCEVAASKKNSDEYVYCSDFSKIGTQIVKNDWFGSYIYDDSYNKEAECSDILTANKKESFSYFMDFCVPNTNVTLNIAVNFDMKNIESENSTFRNGLLILFITTYIIFSFTIIIFGRYTENKYLNAEVILKENKENKDGSQL